MLNELSRLFFLQLLQFFPLLLHLNNRSVSLSLACGAIVGWLVESGSGVDVL